MAYFLSNLQFLLSLLVAPQLVYLSLQLSLERAILYCNAEYNGILIVIFCVWIHLKKYIYLTIIAYLVYIIEVSKVTLIIQ